MQQPEYYFDWATLASTTVPGTPFPYELLTDQQFFDLSDPYSYVLNVTNTVVAESGATDAYSKALAIEDFIINGNATTEFKRNYDGAGTVEPVDATLNILAAIREGNLS